MKIGKSFKGIYCLPVTPFTKDDDIDEEALRTIVDIIIEDGADGLVPTGGTGEYSYLLHEERKRVQEIVNDQANGRVPVLAGTTATNTKEAVIFTKYAKDIGCEGVMISHPILLDAKEDQIYSFYEKIANTVDIPILVYNGAEFEQTMSPNLVERLATNLDNVVSYKEDDYNYLRFAEVIRRCKNKMTIFTGSLAMLYTFLSLGADGALVAQFQLFPHLVKGVFESYSKGDLKKTLEFHEKSMELYNIINKYFGNANLAAQCKAIWRLRGVDMEFAVRHPHFPVTQEQLDRAEPEFMKLGLQKIH